MFSNILTKPYPFSNPGIKKWKTILFFGFFIALFLLIFQPFGISTITGKNKIYIIIGYGFITMLMLLLNVVIEIIFTNIFNEKNWVVYKQILWVLWIVFTIGLGNLIYTHIVFSYPVMNFSNFFFFQLITICVAILPLLGFVLITQNRLLKQNVSGAANLNHALHKATFVNKKDEITLWSENDKESFTIDVIKLLFIESLGNYIKIYYLNEDKVVFQVLRSSLKRINDNLKKHKNIFQCHRAFIVNLSHIIKIMGNAQGYRLKLLNTEYEVPVSRSFIKEFNRRLQNK